MRSASDLLRPDRPRFSGHESFACRYAWIPKAVRALESDARALVDDEAAMVSLGVGKNMVRSIRFWIEAFGVACPKGGGAFNLSSFGHSVFGSNGRDRWLEHRSTQWLLHWRLASRRRSPLFAWSFVFNDWEFPDFTKDELLTALRRAAHRHGHEHSDVTLAQHLDVLLMSYVGSARRSQPIEDGLDGPLVELRIIETSMARAERREPTYLMPRSSRPDVSDGLFAYVLDDFWRNWRPDEQTLTFSDVVYGRSGPGNVLRLSEEDVRDRLERCDGRLFRFRSSALQGLLVRSQEAGVDLLGDVYERY